MSDLKDNGVEPGTPVQPEHYKTLFKMMQSFSQQHGKILKALNKIRVFRKFDAFHPGYDRPFVDGLFEQYSRSHTTKKLHISEEVYESGLPSLETFDLKQLARVVDEIRKDIDVMTHLSKYLTTAAVYKEHFHADHKQVIQKALRLFCDFIYTSSKDQTCDKSVHLSIISSFEEYKALARDHLEAGHSILFEYYLKAVATKCFDLSKWTKEIDSAYQRFAMKEVALGQTSLLEEDDDHLHTTLEQQGRSNRNHPGLFSGDDVEQSTKAIAKRLGIGTKRLG